MTLVDFFINVAWPIICVGLCFILPPLCEKWEERQDEKFRKLHERIEQIKECRIKVIYIFGPEAYNSLPSFDEMYYDTKEVTVKNYLNPDIFINLN